MGNYQGCMCASPMVMDMEELVGIPLLVTLLQAESGKIYELHKATTVAEVMLENPHQFVCHFNNILLFGGGGHLQSTRYFSALGADYQLQLGQWYILLPMHKLHKRIYPSDVDYFKSLLRAAYAHNSSTTPRQSITTTANNTNLDSSSSATVSPARSTICSNKVAPSSLSDPIQEEEEEKEEEEAAEAEAEAAASGNLKEHDGEIHHSFPPPPPPFPFPSFGSLRSLSFPSEYSDPSDISPSSRLLQRNFGRCRSWVPKLETISEATFA